MTMTLERPTTRSDVVQPEIRVAVDELFLNDPGHALIAIDRATADPTEHVREWELSPEQRQVYEAGYMVGFQMAAPELMAEVLELRARLEQSEHDADRYYAEMCRRPAPAEPSASGSTFAEISRARGEDDRADRHDATIDRMFPQYSGAHS
ncbi:hypothetical protein [Curtobacterium sp. VKM Ac-2887]|uniref:hypothetical protein n=1 Tax=Curtobacterium sp. VKM Ac-2887 TaxID=2783819 RepID=UPI00188A5AF2|nr:hypothetical protein [Curtobacterium sp. VKM Ac-2887]MBF4588382.1 hypothetical protein [Curtobacterium sp. VKM Ac-2887]